MAAGISVHCVDVAHGQVAQGMAVALHRLDALGAQGERLAQGAVGPRGLWEEPTLTGSAMQAGSYELLYGLGAYFRQRHPSLGLPCPAFLEEVSYRFRILDASQHIHLPLKFTPWGFSLFLGVA